MSLLKKWKQKRAAKRFFALLQQMTEDELKQADAVILLRAQGREGEATPEQRAAYQKVQDIGLRDAATELARGLTDAQKRAATAYFERMSNGNNTG